MNLKKAVIVLVTILITAFITTGLSFAGNIVLWHSLNQEGDELLKELSKKYSETHETVNIDIVKFTSSKELYVALMDPKKELPNLAIIDSLWQNELKNNERILCADDYLLTSVRIVAKLDTYKPLWKACCFEDKLWTLPYFAYNHALVYDENLFKEYGIKTAPATWAELYSSSKKISKDEDTAGFYIPLDKSDAELTYLFQIFLAQAGGANYEASRDGINGEYAERVLYYWRDLLKTHKVATDKNDISAGIMVGTPADVIKMTKARQKDEADQPVLKAVRWPVKSKTGDIALWTIALMKKDTENQNDIDQSWYFAYYLTEFPQLEKLVLKLPYFPANKQVTLSPNYFQYLETYPTLRMYLTLMDKGYVRPDYGDDEKLANEVGAIIRQVLTDKLEVTEGTKQIMKVVNEELKFEGEQVMPKGVNKNTYPDVK